jgi:hypothetical protein
VRPVLLALEGTSPSAFLSDLANDPEFNGTVVFGVTTGLYFSGYMYRKDVLDYARKESPSQRADHILSMPLERAFAFLEEMMRPKTIIFFTDFPLRKGMERRLETPKIEVLGPDRAAQMWRRVVDDPAYADYIKLGWADGMRGARKPGPDGKPCAEISDENVSALIAATQADVDKIRAKGGDVAFVRFPYEGEYRPFEDQYFPRALLEPACRGDGQRRGFLARPSGIAGIFPA